MDDINFTFTVETCLDADDIQRLRNADGAKGRWQVLNEIFGEDQNIWEAFYDAASSAFAQTI